MEKNEENSILENSDKVDLLFVIDSKNYTSFKKNHFSAILKE